MQLSSHLMFCKRLIDIFSVGRVRVIGSLASMLQVCWLTLVMHGSTYIRSGYTQLR